MVFNEIPFTIKKQKKNGPFRVSVRLNFIFIFTWVICYGMVTVNKQQN